MKKSEHQDYIHEEVKRAVERPLNFFSKNALKKGLSNTKEPLGVGNHRKAQ